MKILQKVSFKSDEFFTMVWFAPTVKHTLKQSFSFTTCETYCHDDDWIPNYVTKGKVDVVMII